MTDRQQLVIRRGRHFGWWIDGRSSRGRRYMFHWWPTKSLALAVARLWAAVSRRAGGGQATIEVRDAEVRDAEA